MDRKIEKRLAGHLLHHRDHGYSICGILLRNRVRYMLLVMILILGIIFLLQDNTYYVIVGITIGVFARDFGWIRQGKKAWPLYEKVINWEQVEDLAKSEITSKT